MCNSSTIPRAWLPGLLALVLVNPLPGQQASPRGTTESASAQKPVEFKGEARVSVHSYPMEKGSTYRITVKAAGFAPLVRIPGQDSRLLFPTALSTPGTSPTSTPTPNLARDNAQIFFMPAVTKTYPIKIDYVPGTDVGKEPLTYTLLIERAVFKPHAALGDPPLSITEMQKKMDQGKVYQVTVTGNGFGPEVQIMDGNRPVATGINGRWFGFGPDAECINTLTFQPTRTADYRILVSVGPVSAKQRRSPLTYTTQIDELKVNLSLKEQLTKQDPVYPRRGSFHKVHPVKLEAGKKYQIDMTSPFLDSYLVLEDSAGNIVMEDDDGGEGLNARIIFQPTRTGTYRIVATTFVRAGVGSAVGPYSLLVVENPQAQPRFRAPPVSNAVPGSPPP